MLISAGVIAAIVLWGLLAPASRGAVFDSLYERKTRYFRLMVVFRPPVLLSSNQRAVTVLVCV